MNGSGSSIAKYNKTAVEKSTKAENICMFLVGQFNKYFWSQRRYNFIFKAAQHLQGIAFYRLVFLLLLSLLYVALFPKSLAKSH